MSIDGGAPKKGMGAGAKVLIILGIVAGVGLLICCGGAGMFMWKAKPTVTQVPTEVTTRTTAILPVEIPEDKWEPAMHMSMSVPFIMDMSIAHWKSKLDDGGMILTRVLLKVKDDNASQEQIDQQMEQAFSQGGGNGQQGEGQMAQLNVDKSEDRTVTMLGKETTLKYVEGKRPGSDDEWREIKGSVKDGDSIIVIRVQAKAENFDEAEIIEMLESAK